jgi:uncharacterized protein
MNPFIVSLSMAVIGLAVFLVSKPFDKRLKLGLGVLFAVYLALDDLVTGLPSAYTAFRFVQAEWNWSGKIYSLVLSVVVLLVLRINARAAGITFTQKNLKASLIALGLFIVWGLLLGLLFNPPPPSLETIAFQGTMPGLMEETVYRGIAPAILLGLIWRKKQEEGIPWTVVFITAIMFGVWHGLGYSNAGFSFDAMSALFPFIGSIAGGWLRFNSGSLLFPILVHSVANVAFQLAPLIRL